MTPAVGSDTTTAWGISGKIQYRPHNADRSKRGLLNTLPRTSSLASPRGEAKEDVRGRVFNSPRFDLSALCGLY